MIDPDQVPPRDFQWFDQAGGSEGNKGIADSCIVTRLEAQRPSEDYTGPIFDPKHPSKANMWTAHRDKKGTRHQVSVDLQYHFVEPDLRNVAALLRFFGDSAATQSVNRFLKIIREDTSAAFQQRDFRCGAYA
ncbi:MAG: hypothetical protein HFG12_05725 [Oscillibacter sp.]|nr:hypothetical protein [uncultured Oscillibacter sp.]MCI8812716.1 hypothetical protein [Oscillibacter sp.]